MPDDPVRKSRLGRNYTLEMRTRAYRITFGNGEAAVEVLRDLAEFCRGMESTFDPDPRIHALLEGRREVLLRILRHVNLTPAQHLALIGGRPVQLRTEE